MCDHSLLSLCRSDSTGRFVFHGHLPRPNDNSKQWLQGNNDNNASFSSRHPSEPEGRTCPAGLKCIRCGVRCFINVVGRVFEACEWWIDGRVRNLIISPFVPFKGIYFVWICSLSYICLVLHSCKIALGCLDLQWQSDETLSKAKHMSRQNIPQFGARSLKGETSHLLCPCSVRTKNKTKIILISKFLCRAAQTEADFKHFSFFIAMRSFLVCRLWLFSELIKDAFSSAMHGTRPAEESLLNLFVFIELAGPWLQILRPIIEIAAMLKGAEQACREEGASQ